LKLLIISHTKHYRDSSGKIKGWGPTVREINFISDSFDEVYHCAPLHEGKVPDSSIQYTKSNIHFVPLKPSGGRSLSGKLKVLFTAPYNLYVVYRALKKADVFQFRAPTGIGVYLIPFLTFFVNKKGWFKYAGNWNQEKPPMGYALQRYMLKKQKRRKVTINGKWPDQPEHCITFENPCLNNAELNTGAAIVEKKNYSGKLNFCFVGRLESAKGVRRILNVFSKINNERIGTIHFVGDGKELTDFKAKAEKIPYEIVFHGFLSRDKVADVLKECHVFLLPSTASEGFPKVIAEAANYGCLPVVSNVSSIAQYVKDGENGFLVKVNSENMEKELIEKIETVFRTNDLKSMVLKAREVSKLFTFEHYTERILNEIIDV